MGARDEVAGVPGLDNGEIPVSAVAVLQILFRQSQTDRTLAAQLQAAVWEAKHNDLMQLVAAEPDDVNGEKG